MLNWRRWVGSISHRYICIVVYMKLIWYNCFLEISAQLMGGRSASRFAKFGVAVFKASLLQLVGG